MARSIRSRIEDLEAQYLIPGQQEPDGKTEAEYVHIFRCAMRAISRKYCLPLPLPEEADLEAVASVADAKAYLALLSTDLLKAFIHEMDATETEAENTKENSHG